MNYNDFPTVQKTLNREFKGFLLFMCLYDDMKVTGDAISQEHQFEMNGGYVTVRIEATANKISVNATHNNELMINFDATYSEEQMDWIIEDDFILSGSTYSSIDSWQLFEYLSELTNNLSQELIVEV